MSDKRDSDAEWLRTCVCDMYHKFFLDKDLAEQCCDRIKAIAAELERLREENRQWREVSGKLNQALEDLESVQNGCPLPKYEEGWNKAVDETWHALESYSALTKEMT